ncbi:class E sortase [Streptomyces diastaticus]|uniref:class E sortase n=1 Tax=Streptomyces diastaticus TaxID=1956 RepID=UPI00365F6F47
MTALRPERESATGGPVDPLTDPLPDVLAGGHSSPWFRADQPQQQPEQGQDLPAPRHGSADPYTPAPAESYSPGPPPTYQAPAASLAYGAGPLPAEVPTRTGQAPYDAHAGYTTPDAYPPTTPDETYGPPETAAPSYGDLATPPGHGSAEEEYHIPAPEEPRDDETMALRAADPVRTAEAGGEARSGAGEGGRAARRKAAKRNARAGGRRAGTGRRRAGAPAVEGPGARDEAAPDGGAAERPRTRVEARRAERARRPSAATVASGAIGELFITIGVLMLLFVTYQLWWTNVRAQQQADGAANSLQQDWEQGKRKPGAFEAGQGFAIIHIPKLDVVVPVASGIDKQRVLDRGMAGHYAEGALKTALPGAKKGNFAVAGHRNTHGEPFRYINRLTPGDPIVVETQDTYYVYEMASILPQTPPSNTAVIDPVPAGSGFTEPGRYITLTTCTPEFTSTYRMIVWGKMVEERPRSKGKPDALVD